MYCYNILHAKNQSAFGAPVLVGDSGEDSFFDISGEVISEMAPKPHPLATEGTTALAPSQCSSASSANHSNETGTFPQLDSNLLQVFHSGCMVVRMCVCVQV